MMTEAGKSDRPVVPVKSPNKAAGAPVAAEGMEGRDLAKENAEPAQQVDRTLRRVGAGSACPEDLQNALDRIRRAVQRTACA